jgi:dTDP-4-dehydrorhamnose reductase
MTRRILLTGGSGQVGQALRALDWPADVVLVVPGRADLDLAEPDSIIAYLGEQRLDAILSVGAYTAVDRAESDADTARRVNADAPGLLAAHAAKHGAPIIHISTDYVFDGGGVRPWREDDPVNPIGVYGATKEAGEHAVRAANPRHAILRTSWVVSATGHNFIRTMLRLGQERESVSVVADQHGAPTHAGNLAAAVRTIALRLMADASAPWGTFHIANGGETSWHGVAEHVFAAAARRGLKTPKLRAITTADYPTPARRPANSRLDCTKVAREFGVSLRPWQEAVDEIVGELTGVPAGVISRATPP